MDVVPGIGVTFRLLASRTKVVTGGGRFEAMKKGVERENRECVVCASEGTPLRGWCK